jgi:tight adherence protein C
VIVVAMLAVLASVMIGGAVRATPCLRRTRRPPQSAHGASAAAQGVDPCSSAPGGRSNTRPTRAVRIGLIGLVTFGAAALLGPALLLIVATGLVTVRRARTIVRQRRARLEIERSIPDTVELFILLVHAGLTPVRAIHELARVAPEATRAGFAAVVRRLDRGEAFGDALAALPERLGPGMVVLIDLVASADRHGSPLGPMLESLAFEARSARRRQHEADARRLPVRLSFPLVTCTLPSFVLLAIAPALIAALASIRLSV